VSIRHPEPQLEGCHFEPQLKECHVLNPYPKPQLRGYVPSHNSRNTSKPTFKVSLKPCRSHTSIVRTPILLHASRPLGEGRVPPMKIPTLQTPLGGPTLTDRRTHSRSPLTQQLLLGGTTFIIRRYLHQNVTVSWLSPGDSNPAAKRYTSNIHLIAFAQF